MHRPTTRRPMRSAPLLLAASLLAACSLTACSSGPTPHEARQELERDLATLERALTRHASTRGSFASSLEDLAREGLVQGEHLRDPWGRDYGYVPAAGGRFDLFSYGADGRPGGEGEAADVDLAGLRRRRP